MNIVSLVSYPFLPAKTGGQKGIALFYKYFCRFHTVTCVTTKSNDPALAEGYALKNVLSASRFRYVNLFYFFRLRKLIREKKASHLIIEHPYYGWLGVLLRISCGIKLVVHSHNLEGLRWKSLGKWWWRILWHYERFTHRNADFNFFISDVDRSRAIREFGLYSERCLTVSFGIEIPGPPVTGSMTAARHTLVERYAIPPQTKILFFNGAFKYQPNREALEDLLHRINPELQNRNFSYRLLICGIDIPEKYFNTAFADVRVLGFAEDLETYLLGSDVFLNPVMAGGGIKTKLVEALGYNMNTVSTVSGAAGVDPDICGGKLRLCADGDWQSFAQSIISVAGEDTAMPAVFYDHFYWGHIARRAAEFICG